MATNSQCSSMLLLILIGLALYLLLNTSENFKTKKKEFFNSIMGSVSHVDNSQSTNSVEPIQTVSTLENIIPQPHSSVINYDIPPSNYDTPSSNYDATSSSYNVPSTNNLIDNQHIDVRPIPQGSFNPLITYQANDDSIFNDNAPLNMAFTSPLEPGTNADVIDFKKGNVDNYNAKDFLPREINDEWFETDFSLAKYQLNDDKLINTDRYIIGINTIGSSLKNASKDIRGTISNPKFTVSPWNNSSYEPDFNLKPLC